MALRLRPLLVAALVAAAAASACTGSISPKGQSGSSGQGGSGSGPGTGAGGAGGGFTGPEQFPFEAMPPYVYAAKVKYLTTGIPLTDEELGAVNADAKALRGLIDGWMATPQWKVKLLDFFKQSFQQTQVDIDGYNDQIGRDLTGWANTDQAAMVKAAEESFARTAMALMDEGRPFTEVVTTRRFMLNPPLMAAMAYADAVPRNDAGRNVNAGLWLTQKYPTLTFTRTSNVDPTTLLPVPIPLAETLDPASPNFMKWYDPMPYTGTDPNCADPYVRTGTQALGPIVDFIYGGRPGCGRTTSQWTAADWTAWRMVTVRTPAAGEERTTFWDLPKLRDTANGDLVLNTPRVGFMTTPAFFANWPTNTSNSYRVTTNQTLIVALGRSFDDRGTTVQVTESSDDSMHVQPGTACYGCHVTLDPMRDFFRQSFSVVYSQQLADLTRAGIPASGTFTVDGSAPVTGAGVGALAGAIAGHPRFAKAWAQKLCAFANSTTCEDTDPELARVSQVFVDSGYNFATLVREVLSSPLVTFASRTLTADVKGVSVGIARREPLCGALENRLLANACGLQAAGPAGTPGPTGANLTKSRNLALSVPGAGYARGDDKPLLPHDPSMFFSAAADNLCATLAAQLVDAGTPARFASTDPPAAVRDLVNTVMGVPSTDPRFGDLSAILMEHYTQATAAQGTSRTAATTGLRSTFILACSSPLGTSTGL